MSLEGAVEVRKSLVAFWFGIRDGWQQPLDLVVGLTWPEEALNEAYDRGANLGQFLRRAARGQ